MDAKVPHGLFNPELSLVAVPGIPETNINVLEHLRESAARGLDEKDVDSIAEKVAAKITQKDSASVEKLKGEVSEAKTKLTDVEGKLKTAESAGEQAKTQLATANKTIEDLQKRLPGGGLLKDRLQ